MGFVSHFASFESTFSFFQILLGLQIGIQVVVKLSNF
jgi:hypothetical protein